MNNHRAAAYAATADGDPGDGHSQQVRIGMRLLLPLVGLAGGALLYVILMGDLEVRLSGMLKHGRVTFGIIWADWIFIASFFLLSAFLSLPLVLACALANSLVSTALLLAGSLRFAALGDYVTSSSPVSLGFPLLQAAITLPFMVAWFAGGEKRLWNYNCLFTTSWQMFISLVLSGIVLCLFWLVYSLGAVLLGTLGFTLLQDIATTLFVILLSGAVLGLSHAFLHEVRHVVIMAYRILLGMLDIIAIPASIITGILVVLLPFRLGQTDAWKFSPGGMFLLLGFISVSLISAVAGERGTIRGTIRDIAARVLGVGSLVLALTGLWWTFGRIGLYGLTPTRVLAVSGGLVVLSWGIFHALGAFLPDRKRAGAIRTGNTVTALGLIGLCIIWQAGPLDPYRLSAESQLARFQATGAFPPKNEIWLFRKRWGLAGVNLVRQLTAAQAGLATPDAEAGSGATLRKKTGPEPHGDTPDRQQTPPPVP